MSKIVVIAKVPHHIEEMKKVLEQTNQDIPLLYAPDSERCFEIAAREVCNGAKIIICSDFLYHHYFDSLNVRIIPIIRSPYLFAKKIAETVRRDPRTVVICRSDANSFTSSVEAAVSLLDCKPRIRYANDDDELNRILGELEQDGETFPIISPVWCFPTIAAHGFETATLPFAQEDFRNCLNQAITELTLMEEQEKFSEIFSTVLDFITVGIICLDNNGIITGINKVASDRFMLSGNMIGQSCSTVGLSPLFELAEKSVPGDTDDAIIQVGDVPAKVSVLPQFVGGTIKAYVATLSPVDEILADERRIRRSIGTGANAARLEYSDIIGTSPAITTAKRLAKRFASVDSTVLITGPTGCGKEVFAQSIHNLSNRRDQPFVAINCAALPESLLESILFGYDKGSFTGAHREGKRGLFEAAHKGTIFLDEISEMPLAMQARFLRVIQEREVMRIGSSKPIPIDVRIIAATNRDLRTMVAEKAFREDLYYRISVLVLEIPPLSQRRQDIPLLASYFLNSRGKELGCPNITIDGDALSYISALNLSGNVRELNNILERCIILSDRKRIDMATVRLSMDHTQYCEVFPAFSDTPSASEKERIQAALAKHNGNRMKTAESLGISTATLWRKMKKYELL